MYIRFVVGQEDEDHRKLTGLITEASLLAERGELALYESQLLEDIFEWFNENLPCPPFSGDHWPEDAVSWFKPEATEPIKKMWELASLLKEHDIPIRILKSEMPGRSWYEDEYQIVVVEKKRL